MLGLTLKTLFISFCMSVPKLGCYKHNGQLMTHQSVRFTHVVLQDIKKTDLPTEELNICSKKILSRGYGNLTYQVEEKLTNLRPWASRGIRDPRLMIMIDEFFKEERDFRQKFGKYAFGDA